MSKQLIVAISREFGSGGHTIGGMLSERLSLPLYDSNLLREITTEKKLDITELQRYDELPKKQFFSRTIRGFSNSPEENIAMLQFDYIKKMAKEGKSFLILGRCGEAVLKDYSCLVSIFIIADMDSKIDRISRRYCIAPTEAESLIKQQNSARKAYHNYYCTGRWGDSRNYDISINSSRLGAEGTVDILEGYIKERYSRM